MVLQQKRLPSLLFTVATTVGYLAYGIATFLFIALFPLVKSIFFWNARLQHTLGESIHQNFLHFLSRSMLPALRIYRIAQQRGFEQHAPSDKAIFVANHRSLLDGPLLIPLLPNTGIIMKSKYAHLSLYATLVRHLDFISVNPHSIESLAKTMHKCEELLLHGKRLLIFPEGTRATSSRVNHFKDLAFRLSIETGTAIIPLVVHTDLPFMAKIRRSLFPPRTFSVTLRALSPQYPIKDERPTDFADRIRKMIRTELVELDKDTVWETCYTPGNAALRIRSL